MSKPEKNHHKLSIYKKTLLLSMALMASDVSMISKEANAAIDQVVNLRQLIDGSSEEEMVNSIEFSTINVHFNPQHIQKIKQKMIELRLTNVSVQFVWENPKRDYGPAKFSIIINGITKEVYLYNNLNRKIINDLLEEFAREFQR